MGAFRKGTLLFLLCLHCLTVCLNEPLQRNFLSFSKNNGNNFSDYSNSWNFITTGNEPCDNQPSKTSGSEKQQAQVHKNEPPGNVEHKKGNVHGHTHKKEAPSKAGQKNAVQKNEPHKEETQKNEPHTNESNKNVTQKNEPQKNEPQKNESNKNITHKNESNKNERHKNEKHKNVTHKDESNKNETHKNVNRHVQQQKNSTSEKKAPKSKTRIRETFKHRPFTSETHNTECNQTDSHKNKASEEKEVPKNETHKHENHQTLSHKNKAVISETPKNEALKVETVKNEVFKDERVKNETSKPQQHKKDIPTNEKVNCQAHSNEAPSTKKNKKVENNFLDTTVQYYGVDGYLKDNHEQNYNEKDSSTNVAFLNRGIIDYIKKRRKRKKEKLQERSKLTREHTSNDINHANETNEALKLDAIFQIPKDDFFENDKYIKFYFPVKKDAQIAAVNYINEEESGKDGQGGHPVDEMTHDIFDQLQNTQNKTLNNVFEGNEELNAGDIFHKDHILNSTNPNVINTSNTTESTDTEIPDMPNVPNMIHMNQLPVQPDIPSTISNLDNPDNFDNTDNNDNTQTTNILDIPDIPNTTNTTNTTNTPDISNIPNSPDIPNTINIPDMINIPDTTNIPDISNIPNSPDIPNTTNIPDSSNIPNSPDIPNTTNIPDSSNILNVPNISNNPNNSNNPNISSTTSIPNTSTPSAATNFSFNVNPNVNISKNRSNIGHIPRPFNDYDLLRVINSNYRPDDANSIRRLLQSNNIIPQTDVNYGDFNLAGAIMNNVPTTPQTQPHLQPHPYPPTPLPNPNPYGPRISEPNSCSIHKDPNNLNVNGKVNDHKHLSLRYLGLGYDIILGNPEGEPGLNIDPGYKGPILQLNIENINTVSDKETIKKGMLTPWVIPEHSCNQSKNVEEIKNLDQYKTELSADVSISTPMNVPYSFSASTEFKNMLNKLKLQNNIIFMMKIYCLRYYSGIPISKQWKFTKHFQKALENLPNTFEGLKEDSKCTYKDYKVQMESPECDANVNKWIYFFRLHGTHITHEIYLGGKIILKVNAEKDVYNLIKQKNISMKSLFQFHFGHIGFGTSYKKAMTSVVSKYNLQKNISILGGNPGLDVENNVFFEKWVQSIVTNSMPIRTKLIPFSYFMDDPQMIQAYKDALTFYGLSYGVRIIDQEKYNNHVLSIGSYLEQCIQNIYSGSSPGLLTCPHGSSIVMGFSLNLEFVSNTKVSSSYGLFPCEQLKESCSGNALTDSNADTRIWALCSTNPIEFITQVVEQAESPKLTATCPEGLVILFGFALMKGLGRSAANAVDIYPCRTGQNSCSAVLQNSKYKQSMIYITCVDNTTIGLEHLQTYSQVKNLKRVNSTAFKNDGHLQFACPQNSKLVFGFSLEFHTNFPLTRSNFLHCSKTSNSCKIGGIGVNSRLSFFRNDKHSLATVAVCNVENAA